MSKSNEPLETLFQNNKQWSDAMTQKDRDFFKRLSQQQAPEYLWIGCADSRVPANEIVGMLPGELFVHRNVANVVVHSDLNCLSVIQFAVEALKVKHIIVCGHYGCGGVRAAVEDRKIGMIDNWLRHVQDVHHKHKQKLEQLHQGDALVDSMCELNVIEQVVNVCRTSIVRDAWTRQQPLSVHGWIYGLTNGMLHDLKVSISSAEELQNVYSRSIAGVLEQ